ncbi:MAG TPA: hypothetical protein VFM61_00895, partial [Pseudidiomarina sp.]|nr:hypothetical protein [Pseudidiomarina sp.]
QRIAHGHRSRLYIALNGQRQPQLETEWAHRWQDIYLGSREDVKPSAVLQRSVAAENCNDQTHVGYSYVADQGLFELLVPRSENYVIPSDSTVECIADYLAGRVKEAHPDEEVTVTGFEGVGKGAIGYA